MPGLFGAVGLSRDALARLAASFARHAGAIRTIAVDDGVLGAEGVRGQAALNESAGRTTIAVDGEPSIYRIAAEAPGSLYRMVAGIPRLTPSCKGNLVVVDRDESVWFVAAEWSGSFPLYYGTPGTGLVFSNRVRPLAEALDAPADETGVIEFLLMGYAIAGRTAFRGVRRLLPGQLVRFDRRAGTFRVHETSELWTRLDRQSLDRPRRTAEELWALLGDAVDRSLSTSASCALMMSGGWDSRTLLAAIRDRYSGEFRAYSHGDLESREFRLIRAVCGAAGVPVHCEPLPARVFEPTQVEQAFEATENSIFPHWYLAGERLARMRVDCSTSGTYGEVLGGHYGRAMIADGLRRISAVVTDLFRPNATSDEAPECARAMLRLPKLDRPWYLADHAWRAQPELLDAINADIEAEVDRLLARGVSTRHQVIEAYISEHRGAQHINGQMLSSRGPIDVCLPFTDQELLRRSAELPIGLKIHNSMNRLMLRETAPELLRFPMAATLIGADRSIRSQEASRLGRKLLEESRRGLARLSGGAIGPPRLGWLNFESVKRSGALEALAAGLRHEMWDLDAVRSRIAVAVDSRQRGSIHPLVYQLLTIKFIDMLLSGPRR